MKNNLSDSLRALRRDKRFAPLIKKHGIPDLKRGKNPFQALVRSIIHQQVSGAAAETIHARFVGLFQPTDDVRPTRSNMRFPSPEIACAMPLEKMRAAGLSGQKASYIKDLAEKFCDGTIRHRALRRMQSEA